MFTMKDIQNDNCAAHVEATSIFKEGNTCAIPFNKDSYAIIKSFNPIGIMNCLCSFITVPSFFKHPWTLMLMYY